MKRIKFATKELINVFFVRPIVFELQDQIIGCTILNLIKSEISKVRLPMSNKLVIIYLKIVNAVMYIYIYIYIYIGAKRLKCHMSPEIGALAWQKLWGREPLF